MHKYWLYIVFFLCLSIPVYSEIGKDGNSEKWQVLQSDRTLIRLIYQNPSTGRFSPSKDIQYLGLFPKGNPVPVINHAVFRTYMQGTIFQDSVSYDSTKIPVNTDLLVKLEPLGNIREWRIGRLTITPSQQLGEMNYVLDSVVIDINPGLNETVSMNLLTESSSPEIGLDRVLPKVILNYSPTSPLRQIPDDIEFTPENYPGLVSPDLYNNKKPWVKIPIKKPGLYQITMGDLENLGHPRKSIRPDTFRIFSNGQEIPYQLEIGNKRRLDPLDRIIFYGKPANTPYTEENIYWLTWGGEKGIELNERLFKEDYSSITTAEDSYIRNILLEEKRLFDESIPGNAPETENWYWKSFSVKTGGKISFQIEGTDRINEFQQEVAVEFRFQGKNKSDQSFGHSVVMTWDETTVGEFSWSGQALYSYKTSLPTTLFSLGKHNLSITLTGKTPATSKDEVYLKNIGFHFIDKLLFPEKDLIFSVTTGLGNKYYSVTGLEIEDDLKNYRIFAMDTLDTIQPIQVNYQKNINGIYLPVDKMYKNYLIVKSVSIPKPDLKKYIVTDNLRDPVQQYDYLLITHPEFRKSSERLAEYRRKQGLKVRMVDIHDIYDQFSYGYFDPRAIRSFLQYTMYYWSQPYPSYVLFFGDGTKDYRGNYRNGVINYIPPYRMHVVTEEAASDLWYTQVVGEDLFPDIFIGRISVNNVEDAESVIDKTIQYETEPELGPWRSSVLFVSDDGFEEDSREISRNTLPLRYKREFVDLRNYGYIDNYYLPSTEDSKISPDGNQAVMDAISEGQLAVIYFGHGSPNVWAHERILFGGDSKNSDMKKLKNGKKLPFVVNLTCSTGEFDWPTRPWNICLSEDMHRIKEGGAIALYTPSGKGFTPQHKTMTEKLTRAMFLHHQTYCGDIIGEAVIQYYYEQNHDSTPQMFNLFGDPALQISLVPQEMEIQSEPKEIRDGTESGIQISGITSNVKTGRVNIDIHPEPEDIFTRNRIYEKNFNSETMDISEGRFITQYPVDKWINSDKITVRAYAWDSIQKLEDSGEITIPRITNKATLSIDSMVKSDDGKINTFVSVSNNLSLPISDITLRILVNNESHQSWELKDILPGDKIEKNTEFNFNPGVYTLQLAATYPDGMSNVTVQRVWVENNPTGIRGSLVMSEGDITIEPPVIQSGQSHKVKAIVHNISELTYSNITIVLKENYAINSSIQIISMEPYSSFTTELTWLIPNSLKTSEMIIIANDSTIWRKKYIPSSPVDLSISSTDIRFTKDSYMDGETVFVDVEVHNLGDIPVENVEVQGFENDPNFSGRQFTDRTDWKIPVISKILPKSSKKIRIRWDPRNNAGDKKIYVVVDRNNKIQDSNRTNNKAYLPLHIKTKPDLAIVTTEWIRDTSSVVTHQESRTVLLRATITNKGETDAENAVVQFYDYSTKIGDDLIIPVLKHKEEKIVETKWDMPRGKHNVHVEVGIKSQYEKTQDLLNPNVN